MISIIVPIYNEEKYILQFLEFVDSNCEFTYELILADGLSSDSTLEIIKSFINDTAANNIVLLSNSKKYVSHAMNMAIEKSSYDIVIRMDVHTEYSKDYFKSIIKVFDKSGADIVGGPSNTIAHFPIQKSIAYCFSSIFGMGGGTVHNMNFNGYTNGVTYGAFKKYVFNDNLFNTKMVRNQDDEFFAKCISKGFRIYQSSSIKLYYTPRNKFSSLFSQYYQYGLYKPLALKQVKGSLRYRHLIPSCFVIYVIGCLFFAQTLFLAYALLLIFFSLYNDKPIHIKLLNLITFPVMHASYGIGFLSGLRKIIN